MAIIKLPPEMAYANWAFDPPLGEINNAPNIPVGAVQVPPDGVVEGFGLGGGAKFANYYNLKDDVVAETEKQPPLELNLKAKPANPFTQLCTLKEVREARMAGKYLEYTWPVDKKNTKFIRDCMFPHNAWTDGNIIEVIKNGVFVHKTKKCLVYRPAKFEGHIEVLVGTCGEALEDYTDDECFIKWLGGASHVIYEGN